jgi:hypothetical protein
MAFHITVHEASSNGSARLVYHKRLGTDDDVFRYWHAPAFELGLPLVAQIYHDGLEVRGELLVLLSSELDRLEAHWTETGVGDLDLVVRLVSGQDGQLQEASTPLREHLCQKLSLLRTAIGIATQTAGMLEIS